MIDLVLYFFRQQKLLFYFGLLSLTTIYNYLLAIYFLDLSSFEVNLFNLFTAFSLLWFILCYRSFSKHKQNYKYDREREKQNLLRHHITLQYRLKIKDNIFSKIDLITSFMKEKFSPKGLLTVRVLQVVNSSLALYIENLKIKHELEKAYSVSSDIQKKEFYKNEMAKNSKQNNKIEENLDNFIKELMSKNNNDKKIDTLINEFEHSTQIVSKIQQK